MAAVPNTAINTTQWANELLNIYDRSKLFEPMERTSTPTWNMFQEADDVEARGAALYYRVVLHSAHRVGTPTDGGDIPKGGVRSTLQCHVHPVQVASSLKVTEKMLNAGKGDGSFGGDVLHDAVVECAQNLYSHLETLLVLSDGRGFLATVNANVSSGTSFVASPELGVNGLREGMYIDFIDGSGDVQVGAGGENTDGYVEITDINESTRTVTFTVNGSAGTVDLTAGWGVVISGYYNSAPIGLYGMVDDGDQMDDFFGQSRTTYAGLKAQVEENADTARDYEEKTLRKLIHRIERSCGNQPDVIMTNHGVISAHLDTLVADRRYSVTGKSVPSYGIGYDEGQLFFQYHSNKIPFQIHNDMPNRTMWVLSKKTFRRHTARKAGWLGGANDLLMPCPSSSGGNYELAYLGAMVMDIGFSNRRPKANGAYRDIKDEELAGD